MSSASTVVLADLNMCFGLGIQFGFALQNANVSRIFQTLGAEVEQVPGLWIAAADRPAGAAGDRLLTTWTRLGRRRPYFCGRDLLDPGADRDAELAAAVDRRRHAADPRRLAERVDGTVPPSATSCLAPASDRLRDAGLLHGVVGRQPAAVAAGEVGRGQYRAPGEVPDTVRWAFYAGGAVLLLAVLWTVVTTRSTAAGAGVVRRRRAGGRIRNGGGPGRRGRRAWLLAGIVGIGLVWSLAWDRMLYVLAALPLAYGALRLAPRAPGSIWPRSPPTCAMPAAMRQSPWSVLLLVRPVLHVDLHHARGNRAALRRHRHQLGRVQRGRELGRRAVRGLQRLRRAGCDRDSLDGARAGPARQPLACLARRCRPGLEALPATRSGCCCRWRASASPASILSLPTRCCPTTCPLRMGVTWATFHRDSAAGRGEHAGRAAGAPAGWQRCGCWCWAAPASPSRACALRVRLPLRREAEARGRRQIHGGSPAGRAARVGMPRPWPQRLQRRTRDGDGRRGARRAEPFAGEAVPLRARSLRQRRSGNDHRDQGGEHLRHPAAALRRRGGQHRLPRRRLP